MSDKKENSDFPPEQIRPFEISDYKDIIGFLMIWTVLGIAVILCIEFASWVFFKEDDDGRRGTLPTDRVDSEPYGSNASKHSSR